MRYAGLFRAQGLAERLEQCRQALEQYELSRTDSIDATECQEPPPPDPWREDEDESQGVEESTGLLCQCGQQMQSAMRIDPATTMSMIGFVDKTVARTLPQLLGAVIGQLLAQLDDPRSRHRLCDRLRVDAMEIKALGVF